jgi:hypothetical protein
MDYNELRTIELLGEIIPTKRRASLWSSIVALV